MEKPENYEMTQTEPEINLDPMAAINSIIDYDDNQYEAAHITSCAVNHFTGNDLNWFIDVADDLVKAYKVILKGRTLKDKSEKPYQFDELEPGKQDAVLSAMLLLHGISFAAVTKEHNKACNKACAKAWDIMGNIRH